MSTDMTNLTVAFMFLGCGFVILGIMFGFISRCFCSDDSEETTLPNALADIGPRMCEEECLKKTNCISMNFDTIHFICEINIADRSSAPSSSFSSRDSYIYNDGTAMEQNSQSVCSNVSCPPLHSCVVFNGVTDCIPTECIGPPDVENASPRIDIASIGKNAFYTCVSGLQNHGLMRSTCLPDQTWTSVTAYCGCRWELPYIANAYILEPIVPRIGRTISLKCNSSTHLVEHGDMTSECLSTGGWTQPTGFCGCSLEFPFAEYIEVVQPVEPRIGSTITLKCASSTDLVQHGDLSSECLPTAEWSQPSGFCGCRSDRLPVVQLASAPSGQFAVGDRAKYTCVNGYEAKGKVESVCQPDGTWSAVPGHCRREYLYDNKCQKWYYTYSNPRTQQSAQQRCIDDEGHLFRADSDHCNSLSKNEASGTGDDCFWIDGSDDGSNKNWRYSNDGKVNPTYWGKDQPNEKGDRCISVHKDLKHDWADRPCTEECSFLCERPN